MFDYITPFSNNTHINIEQANKFQIYYQEVFTLNKDERLNAILDILYHEGKVQIRDLVQRFNVADMTIRRDFDYLASTGKIIRTHGGAVLPDDDAKPKNLNMEPSYITRVTEQASSKQDIAHIAAKLIKPNQYIFLDSGTTTLNVAKLVSKDIPCTFITNGVNIAAELLAHQSPKVILIGGEVDLNTWSTRGNLSEAQVSNFHADIAFLGCNSISPDGKVMIGNLAETGLKHKIINISKEIYLLADSSKFDSYSLMTYASVNDFDGIITDNSLAENTCGRIQDLGGNLIFPENE